MAYDPNQVITGLSAAEVQSRKQRGLDNYTETPTSRSFGQILRSNLLTQYNAILATAVTIVLLVGSPKDAVFGFVFVFNILIGVATEYRSKRELDALSILHAPQARVIRDGIEQTVATNDIVQDDIVLLSAGDQVVADCVVLQVKGLRVNESMLTGESEPIFKTEESEVLSGSGVVAGSAICRAIRVGQSAYAQQITTEVKQYSKVHSDLQEAINSILRVLRWVITPLTILLAWSQMRAHGGVIFALGTGGWKEASVSAVAGVVGIIPDGLVLLTSINFALAALGLARRGVLIQQLPAVEVLARVDTLCLDKTGTLTDGNITVKSIDFYAPELSQTEILTALRAVVDQDLSTSTARAIGSHLQEVAPAESIAEISFDSSRKWSGVLTPRHTYVLGAPEILFKSSNHVQYLAQVQNYAGQGFRVVALGVADPHELDEFQPQLPPDLRPAAIIVLQERLRPDAKRTLKYFLDQNVDVKIISGDNPTTVGAVAHQVGLSQQQQPGYDATRLPSRGEEFTQIALQEQVFGRVTPQQKRDLMQSLQDQGRVVAMTGDGVNDAMALKDASLGIAMGSGAAATKAVSKLILLNNEFNILPTIVAQGRRIMANMERVAMVFLTKSIYSAILTLVVSVTAWQYPFLPRHLTLISVLSIGIPSFFLALAPNNQRYRPGFLRRVGRFTIPTGIITGIAIMIVYGMVGSHHTDLQAESAATVTLFIISWWIFAILSRPFALWKVVLLASMAAAFLTVFIFRPLTVFFALQIPRDTTLLTILIVSAAAILAIELFYARNRAHQGSI